MQPPTAATGHDSTTQTEPLPLAGRGHGRFIGFDGIRGIAVLMVILFHAHLLEGRDSLRFAIFEGGWSGVDMFFVLSGFLITGILRRSRDHPRYWRTFAIRRALRILPVYYLVLVLILLLPGLLADGSGGPPFWVYPAFLSNFWLATSQTSLALVVTWSLSIEEQFYLFWPIVVRFANRNRLIGICIAIVVAAPVLRFFVHDPTNEVFYMWTPARIDSLAWGALAWVAWELRSQRLINLAARVAPWGVVLWLVILLVGGGDEVRFELWFAVFGLTLLPVLVAAVLLGIADGQLTRMTRVLDWGPLAHLGKVSFGAYLLHAPVILALRRTAVDGNLYLGMVLAVAITWALASLMWRVLETPLLAQKDRLAPY